MRCVVHANLYMSENDLQLCMTDIQTVTFGFIDVAPTRLTAELHCVCGFSFDV